MGRGNESRARRELVVRWISTVGNYDYMFDWILLPNDTIKTDIGAIGIEAVKAVKSATMHDATAVEDTRYGMLIDHNIVGTTHQHIYNFRLDMDVDGENNALTEINPMVAENTEAVVWITTGATHVARAEEWPIMPTEWVHAMLKPWNFFDDTPTLNLPE